MSWDINVIFTKLAIVRCRKRWRMVEGGAGPNVARSRYRTTRDSLMPRQFPSIIVGAILAAAVPATAAAAQTVVLPASACPQSDPLFASGFETAPAIPAQPSHGSGGVWPGAVTRTISVTGLGTRSYYLYLPASYAPTQSWPLLLALRRANAQTATAAQQTRNSWSAQADAAGFIVVAPVGNSTQGGWGASGDLAEISAVLDDALAHYNVEQSRIYLWGFSAGAHYGHGLALDNADYFAAYGVSAGSLEQYACTDNGSSPPTCNALLAGVQPKIPVDIHLGSSDPLYSPPYTAAGDVTRFQNNGWVRNRNLYYTVFSGGHIYTPAQLGEIWNHLCPFALAP